MNTAAIQCAAIIDQSFTRIVESAAELARGLSQLLARFYETAYAHDPNGLFAWAAYRHHRGTKEPIPEWVLAYFDRASIVFEGVTDSKSQKQLRSSLAEALELNWQVVSNFHDWMRDYDMAKESHTLIEKGHKPYEAWTLVAQNCTSRGEPVGRETVRKAYKRLSTLW